MRRKRRSTNVTLPFVVDAGANPNTWEVQQRLLRDRIVALTGGINDRSATLVIAQLLHLASEDASAPIRLYIDSPGGVVTSSLGIYDTMLDVTPPVESTCIGEAGGMAVLLLAAGQPGKRAAIPTARVLATRLTAHGPDDTTTNAEFDRLRATLDGLFRKHTGRDLESLVDVGPFDATRAIEFGIIDSIVETERSLGH
jgi:ATP-dependent Clp protease, protease subunit